MAEINVSSSNQSGGVTAGIVTGTSPPPALPEKKSFPWKEALAVVAAVAGAIAALAKLFG